MNSKQRITLLGLAFFALMLNLGCTKEKEVGPGKINPFLHLSDSVRTVNSYVGSYFVTIKSDAVWEARTTSDWVKLSYDKSENGILSINWMENEGVSTRIGVVEVLSGNTRKTFRVIQHPVLQIIETSGVLGNIETKEADSVQVRFNQKVKVKSIQANYNFCTTDIKFNYTHNNQGVVFNYSCANMGGAYPFVMDVEDFEGKVIKKSFQVSFYDDRLDIQGSIVNHYVDDANDSYWVLTSNPNTVAEISMEDLSLKSKTLIGVVPRGMALNHLKDELYIFGQSPDIQVLDRRTGMLKRVVKVSEGDVHPANVKFTKNGLGILMLVSSYGHTPYTWRILDSRQNDKIYEHPQLGASGEESFVNFSSIHESFDKTKLHLTLPDGLAGIITFDQATEQLTKHVLPASNEWRFIRTSRKSSHIYVAQRFSQYIFNPASGNTSATTNVSMDGTSTADFSYDGNEPDIIYGFKDNYLLKLSHSTSQTQGRYGFIWQLRGTTTTLDGKFLLAYKPDVNVNTGGAGSDSYIYRFSTKKLK